MEPLEALRGQMGAMKDRVRTYQAQLEEAATGAEREALRAKLTSYRAAMRDIQLQIDHLDPPAQRRARREQRKRLDVGAMSFDFFERCGTRFSDLEGRSWSQVEAGDAAELGDDAEKLQGWLAEGSRLLTDRQRLYLDAYYNQGLSQEAIAARYGVQRSCVCRVIQNGLRRLRDWVASKRLIEACADGKGGFDWTEYLERAPVLTDRQRELLLLLLSRQPKSQAELARKLELAPSTVSHVLSNGGRTLRRLNTPRGMAVSRRPVIQSWDSADRVSLALQTGMGLGFCYRYCYPSDRRMGLTRYQYELFQRMIAGKTAAETAEELGLSQRVVRRNYTELRRRERAGMLRADP